MKKTRLAVAATALLTAFTAFGQSIIFDNSSSPPGSYCNISTLFYQGQGFRTGGSDIFLDHVSLNLAGSFTSISVQLYNGFQPGPGGLVATLTGPASGTGLSTYTPSSSILLHSNTTYVVTAFGSSGTLALTAANPTVGISGGWNEYQVGFGWMGPADPAMNLQMQVVGSRPIISSPVGNTNFQFSVTSLIPLKVILIQASTNLLDWTSISTNVALTTNFNFTDTLPMTNTIRFYRALELP